MSRAIRRIVAPALLSAFLVPALVPGAGFGLSPRGAIVEPGMPEGGADGFPGAEIALAAPDDACLEWSAPGDGSGPYWGSLPPGSLLASSLLGGAEGGIEAPIPVSALDDAAPDDTAPDDAAEGVEGGFFPQGFAALPPCGAGLPGGWPVAGLPAWTPFGGAALEGDGGVTTGGVTGGAVWIGALPANAFWPAWPGFAGITPASVIDNRLATPAEGEDDPAGTVPGDDAGLVVVDPPPERGGTAAVMPEPGMLLLLGLAMVALGLFRRDWA